MVNDLGMPGLSKKFRIISATYACGSSACLGRCISGEVEYILQSDRETERRL